MIRFYLVFALCWLSTGSIFAQSTAEYLRGQLLIQINPDADIRNILAQLREKAGKSAELEYMDCPSKELQIYRLRFDAAAISHPQMLVLARSLPLVRLAQNNHITRQRLTPNDAQFSQQWQYINAGNSGGVANADIDADLAWDITTGGVSPLGDSIVVCIVDDGIDLTHQDILPNLWRNIHEIGGNGIDDDGNGYIDDVQGWNAYDNNNNISGGGHGTSVAGIVGAKGNNGIGVAGVNWDVKLMIVNGGGSEAESIAAYTYPLRMRRLYNQTNGQRGAYVVATNSSWGTDNLQAADAPLWCAFYDTLGSAGIISVGATANRNVNVDVAGDMPTSCRSPYLISVTNLRRNDQKEFSAGYGATTIHLGAYGTDTYTTDIGNGYSAFGGTSGATPHVTGTVALIYAAPCVRLAAQAQADAAGTALMVKDFILQGVTPNSSLNGISITNGRLNTNNALMLAMQSGCALSGCYAPFALRSSSVTGSDFVLSWSGVGDAVEYAVRYRLQGDTVWQSTSTTTDTFFQISALTACTTYEVQVAASCDTTFSNFSGTMLVKTVDCCYAPATALPSVLTDTTAFLSWSPDAYVTTFHVEYRMQGDSLWSLVNSSTPSAQIPNLLPCTNYEYRLSATCPTNVNNTVSDIQTFKTKGCGTCEDADYCQNAATDASYEWIRRVQIGTMNHQTASDGGYADFSGIVSAPELIAGDSIPFIFVAAQSNSSPNWRWRVWLDIDKDGTWVQTNNLVYDSGYLSVLQNEGNFYLPATANGGITRLRVSLKWGSALAQACTSYNYGEIEDYCALIVSPISVSRPSDNAEQSPRILPNPFGDYIRIDQLNEQTYSAQIYNAAGQLCADWQNINSENTQLPTQELPRGLYFLRLQSSTGTTHSYKLLK